MFRKICLPFLCTLFLCTVLYSINVINSKKAEALQYCYTQWDCPVGYTCSGHACIIGEEKLQGGGNFCCISPCMSNSDCPSITPYCTYQFKEVDCIDSCCVECTSSLHCSTGQYCSGNNCLLCKVTGTITCPTCNVSNPYWRGGACSPCHTDGTSGYTKNGQCTAAGYYCNSIYACAPCPSSAGCGACGCASNAYPNGSGGCTACSGSTPTCSSGACVCNETSTCGGCGCPAGRRPNSSGVCSDNSACCNTNSCTYINASGACATQTCSGTTPTCVRAADGKSVSCQCTADSCGAGKKCSSGSCVNCLASEGCGACSCASNAYPNGSGGCTTCGSGTPYCVSGSCKQCPTIGATTGCTSPAQCSSSYACCDSSTPYWNSGASACKACTGTSGLTGTCTTKGMTCNTSYNCVNCTANTSCTCDSGQVANGSGGCVTPACTSSASCSAGSLCVNAGLWNAACSGTCSTSGTATCDSCTNPSYPYWRSGTCKECHTSGVQANCPTNYICSAAFNCVLGDVCTTSPDNCGAGKYCVGTPKACQNCTEASLCAGCGSTNPYWVGGQCRKCPSPGSQTGCTGGQYCTSSYTCATCPTAGSTVGCGSTECKSDFTCCGSTTPYWRSSACKACSTTSGTCPSDPAKYCNASYDCVNCTANSHCTNASLSKCSGSCVICTDNSGTNNTSADCTHISGRPYCKTGVGCVLCKANTHCTSDSASRCDTTANLCTSCANNNNTSLASTDCSHISGKSYCNGGICSAVQCNSSSDCASDATKKVCDTATKVCVATLDECITSPDDCGAGKYCTGSPLKCVSCSTGGLCAGCGTTNPYWVGGACRECPSPGSQTGCGFKYCTASYVCGNCPTPGSTTGCTAPQECSSSNTCCAAATPYWRSSACKACSGTSGLTGTCTTKGMTCNTSYNCVNCAAGTQCTCDAGKYANGTGGCVECTTNTHCPAGKKCDGTGLCVSCAAGETCPTCLQAGKEIGDGAGNCVECTTNTHCSVPLYAGAGKPLCATDGPNKNKCVQCKAYTDCVHNETYCIGCSPTTHMCNPVNVCEKCSALAPFVDPVKGCVQCLYSFNEGTEGGYGECDFNKPKCSAIGGCEACVSPTPHWNYAGDCVECLIHEHCLVGGKPKCTGYVCEGCPVGKYWSRTKEECVDCLSNAHCTADPNKPSCDLTSNLCIACPSGTPIWHNMSCKACPDGSTYNTVTKTCDCPEGTIYIALHNTCTKKHDNTVSGGSSLTGVGRIGKIRTRIQRIKDNLQGQDSSTFDRNSVK